MMIVVGDELNCLYAGDELRKGISKLASFTAPPDAIFLQDALLDKAHLLDLRTVAGVAPTVGFFLDSGGRRWKWREKERFRGRLILDSPLKNRANQIKLTGEASKLKYAPPTRTLEHQLDLEKKRRKKPDGKKLKQVVKGNSRDTVVQESGEACEEPQRSRDVHGGKRSLSRASESSRAAKVARTIDSKVVMTQLKTKMKGRKLPPIISGSPMLNLIARKKAQTSGRSPNQLVRSPRSTGTLKSPSLDALSPVSVHATPASLHALSPIPGHGAPSTMRDRLFPAPTHGSKRRPRKLTSIIWSEPIYIDGFLMQGQCNYCNNIFPASKVSGTSQLARHLKVCEVKCSMDGLVQQMKNSDEIDPDWKFDQEIARSELVKLVVLHGLPFSFVEYVGFRKFCAVVNPWFKPISRITIQNDCIEAYHQYRSYNETFFKNCNHRVSLTGDMWTSNQKLGYLCITCHWIDKNWKVKHRIIRFCLVETPHDIWSFKPGMADGSDYPTSNLYFLEIWSVKVVLDEQEKSSNATIRIMVREMKKKFHKYFMESYLTNCIPVVLDPRFKMELVEFRLKKYFGVGADKHILEVKEAIAALFLAYAAEVEDLNSMSQEQSGEETGLADDALSDFDEHIKLKKANSCNELQRYLEEDFHPRTPDFDILKWWAVNSPRYPVLGNIARLYQLRPLPLSLRLARAEEL
ncbi:zinc finger BED domain-containing protein RICESLEEPER 3-like [Lolium rigidum]|uniref:zinc finger BED domain-containing protein RICESLEEPER 3-like n=1 Tax=Lolium rigidum TaxID=89674 RepID=UPI001F5DA761|nr:zinc finger BED domain-containing protein RICESLEEPER 3-like [Lolium rigidum]